MFDTQKFGGNLSRLRKTADMTQSELADRLNLTRQAVSRYETGDSFPDISILVLIADIFGVTTDSLISAGEPTHGESLILSSVVRGQDTVPETISDVISLAPYLKPSVLDKLAASLAGRGIDISGIVALAEYLNDDSVLEMLQKADMTDVDDKLLAKLIPILDDRSKGRIFQMILDGEMDWHMLRSLMPYMVYMQSQIEAAVIEGCLPWEALDVLHEAVAEAWEREKRRDGQ